VVQIVRRLRRELKAEVARAERMIGRGKALEEIIKRKTRWLSPLGRLIIAHRANRPDLIEAVRTAARHQHESCPLYRRACLTLVPPGIYPAFELVPGIAMTPRTCVLLPTFCLN
jgi:hypothetical protein